MLKYLFYLPIFCDNHSNCLSFPLFIIPGSHSVHPRVRWLKRWCSKRQPRCRSTPSESSSIPQRSWPELAPLSTVSTTITIIFRTITIPFTITKVSISSNRIRRMAVKQAWTTAESSCKKSEYLSVCYECYFDSSVAKFWVFESH